MAGEFDTVLDAEEERLRQPGTSLATGGYDAVLDSEAGARDAQLSNSLRLSLGANPDKAAKAAVLGRKTGIPQEVVESNLEAVSSEARIADIRRAVAASPVLARQLSDPDFAKLAHDDAEQLGAIEKSVGYIRKGSSALLAGLVPVFNAGVWGLAEASGDLASSFVTGPLAGRLLPTDLGASLSAVAKRYRQDQEGFAKDLRREEGGAGFVESAIYDGLSSLGTNLTTLPLSLVTGTPGASLLSMSSMTGGTEYGKARDAGQTLPKALSYAASQAVIEYATEKLPMSRLIGDVKAGTPLYRMLARQVATEIPGEQLATALQDLNEWAVLHPEQPFSAYLKERPSAAAQTLIATLVGVGGQTAIAKAVETAATHAYGQATEAQNAEALRSLVELSKTSKLRERDPVAFSEFVNRAASEGAKDVYVDARTFANALQQAGLDPAAVASQVPAIGEQLAEAIATEGDIRIPVGDFAAHIAPTEAAKSLLPHLRTDASALSQADTAALQQDATFAESLQNEVRQYSDEVARIDAESRAADNVVRAHVFSQLKAAGRFTDDVNQSYAHVITAFYQTMAQRLGETAEGLLRRYPLHIVSQLNLTPAKMLARGAPHPDVVARAGELAEYARQYNVTPDGLVRQWSQNPPSGNTPQGAFWSSYQHIAAAALDLAQHPERLAEARTRLHQAPPHGGSRGAFDPSSNTIALLQNADLSTFIHEAGHFYLEVLTDLAAQDATPQQMKDDAGVLMRWFGVNDLVSWRAMTLDQKRAYHEQFARGFEAYVFEGNSPSIELSGLFQRFRSWLLSVYRALSRLNVELSDEARSVFGRMLATDEAIALAQTARSYRPMFDSAEAGGMTAEQWNEYQRLGEAATSDAAATLQTRSLRAMQWLSNAKGRKLKELQAGARTIRAGVHAEVAAEVNAMPVYQAMRWLKTGELPTGEKTVGARLDLAALREMYGDGPAAPWRYLATGEQGLAGNEGLHPDAVAEMFGFSSGDALVRALIAAERPQSVIEGMTDQRMLERHGDLVDPVSLERAAEAAIHNEARGRFVAAELEALERSAKLQRPTGQTDARGRQISVNLISRAARQFAESSIARKKVQDIRPAQFTTAEARAGRAADKAARTGNLPQAAVHKRAQLVNHQLARVAIDALAEVDRSIAYLRKFSSDSARKSLDGEYVDQIDQLLERHDLRASVTRGDLKKRESLRDWIESQRAQGLEPDISPLLLAEANRQHYREMPLEEFRGLVSAIRQIEHLGHLKQRLLTARDQRAFDEVRERLVDSIQANAKRTVDLRTRNTLGAMLKDAGRRFAAIHRKMASVAREMDGFKDGGPMWEYFVRTMNAAGDREAVMREDATKRLFALAKPLLASGKMGGKGLLFPTLGVSLNREERIAIALNVGNAGNLQRLLAGEGWTLQRIQPVLDSLTSQDWHFVQGVWDFFESYRPLIAAKERRIYGQEPAWVQPMPVQTKFGELRGGYYPIKYDPARSGRAEQHADAEAARRMMHGAYTTSTTRRSFTKSRVDEIHGRPLMYSLAGLYQGANEVIHDLAWHEWLIDVNRLLRNKGIDGAIRSHYGAETVGIFKKAIEDIAGGEVPAQDVFERGVDRLRTGATVAGLGWNVVTSLLQPLGLTQSMVRIGPGWVAKGVSEWIKAPLATVEDIYSRSEMMRLRGKTMQREINEIQNQVSRGKGAARTTVEGTFFILIQKMQLVADVPTWLGAYEKSIAEGAPEGRAIALADQAVIDAQGGGQVKDLAQVQRGGPLQKLFTNFYSFFNVAYNLGVEKTKEKAGTPKQWPSLALDYLLLYSVPAALGALLKHAIKGDDDDDLIKNLIGEQISYLLGTMVGLRELTGAAQKVAGVDQFKTAYGGPAGLRVLQEIDRLGQQLGQGDADMALFKAADNVAGILFHYPSGQINRTVEGAAAIVEGRTQNVGVLIAGPASKH